MTIKASFFFSLKISVTQVRISRNKCITTLFIPRKLAMQFKLCLVLNRLFLINTGMYLCVCDLKLKLLSIYRRCIN